MSLEPSLEPLSATTTSPANPAAAKERIALSTQMPMEFASLRQGMTTDTSSGSSGRVLSGECCGCGEGKGYNFSQNGDRCGENILDSRGRRMKFGSRPA